jgi:hypothetical protein
MYFACYNPIHDLALSARWLPSAGPAVTVQPGPWAVAATLNTGGQVVKTAPGENVGDDRHECNGYKL